jgi:orotate phosphoribosyltransferase
VKSLKLRSLGAKLIVMLWVAARLVSMARDEMRRVKAAIKSIGRYPVKHQTSVAEERGVADVLTDDELMYDRLVAGIFREVLDFVASGQEVAFKANEDLNAPKPPSKFEFRGPELGGRMSQELLDLIGQVLWRWVKGLQDKGLKFDFVAGIPNAGDPIADAVVRAAAAEGVQLQRLWLIKQSHGKRRRITEVKPGNWRRGSQVLLIDDVISHGGSKAEAIRVLRAVELVPVALLLVVNRDQGGVQELLRMGVKTHSVFRWEVLRHRYRFLGWMSQEQCQREEDYLQRDREYWQMRRSVLPEDISRADFDVVTVGRAVMIRKGHDGGCLACDDCWEDARAVVVALWNRGRLRHPLSANDPWPRSDLSIWSDQLADDDPDVILVAGHLLERSGESKLEIAKVGVASLLQYGRLAGDHERQTA